MKSQWILCINFIAVVWLVIACSCGIAAISNGCPSICNCSNSSISCSSSNLIALPDINYTGIRYVKSLLV
ncbi:hypothetical protein TrispH2_008993 [Trichoplax sp. H2]|nr:hypothetical protein TrispH2_008993 [Trichoplax sp. H2]|eukprot:RDD38944.1 hypothetical protein TrispH2_008993 [Trichoplax sp. H2]